MNQDKELQGYCTLPNDLWKRICKVAKVKLSTEPVFINSGSYSHVFALSKTKVLKITRDLESVVFAASAKATNDKLFVKTFLVEMFVDKKKLKDLGAIVAERTQKYDAFVNINKNIMYMNKDDLKELEKLIKFKKFVDKRSMSFWDAKGHNIVRNSKGQVKIIDYNCIRPV